jgi:cyclic pyranopterin phosphate synthase
MNPETFQRIMAGGIAKGDVLEVAKVAGIMGAKRTAELIPMCHPLNITNVAITFNPIEEKHCIEIEAQVKLKGQTGVEMEALTAVATAALTIYDMCKAVDRAMVISDIHLVEKKGGKSGHFVRGT